MIFADFCIVDDYVQALWLTPGSTLSANNLWSTLLSTTEVGGWGTGDRFRPIYFAYMELETWVFGDQPGIFHAVRILFFGLFLGVLGKAFAKSIGLIPALIVVGLVAGFAFWSNVWTLSFGPAEQIAVLGTAITILAYTTIVPRLVEDEPMPAWALPLAGLGTAVAAGSKENFAWLLGPLLVASAIMWARRRLSSLSAALTLPMVSVPLLVLHAIYEAARHMQHADRSGSVIGHRLSTLLAQPFFPGFALGAVLLATATVLMAYRHSRLPPQILTRGAVAFLMIVSFLALDIFWETFFYEGQIPTGTRYDFPILLLPLILCVALAGFVRFAFSDIPLAKLGTALLSIATAAFTVFHFGPAYSLPKAATVAVERTQAFRHDWQRIHALADAHPDWPIVLEPHSPWDGEPIDKFSLWADFFAVRNPILLRNTILPETVTSAFDRTYAKQMENWALNGKPASKIRALPDPTALAALNGRCFAIGFYRPPVSPCQPLPFAPERYIPHD